MPGGDGTGPMGYGPGSGRFAGYCAGYAVPGFANPVPGRRGGWRGFGYSRPWYNPGVYPGAAYPGAVPAAAYPGAVAPDEKRYLEQQAEFLREQLKQIEAELENLRPKEEE